VNRNDNFSVATRASLLSRLKDLASWQEFFDTYSSFDLPPCAQSQALGGGGAGCLVQEVVTTAAGHLPGFHYEPKVCSFRTWLLRLTRWRIIDRCRKRLPPKNFPKPDDRMATAILDRLAGGVAPDLEKFWGAEWEKLVLREALERVKRQVRPEQNQIFDLYALRGDGSKRGHEAPEGQRRAGLSDQTPRG
jgi:hypothetical protein